MWAFGDGDTDTGTLVEENEAPYATGTSTAEHTYLVEPGMRTVILTVTDDEGAADDDSLTVTVEKESVVVTVSDNEGFYNDVVTLEASVIDDDGETLMHGPYEIEFKVGDAVIGSADITEEGSVSIEWPVDIIPVELIEVHPITITFAGNEYYESSQGQGEFALKSTQWLKQDAISELEAVRTGDKKVDKAIDKVIADIEDSLKDKKGSLWIDSSHVVTDCRGDDCYEMDDDDDEGFRGLRVFHEEKKAVSRMMKHVGYKSGDDDDDDNGKYEKSKMPAEVRAVFTEVIDKLVKADQLLAKVAIHDAVNTPVENPNSQSSVDHHIAKAGDYLALSYDELANDRPDKAIKRLEQSWHHAQIAIIIAQGRIESDDDDREEDEEDD